MFDSIPQFGPLPPIAAIIVGVLILLAGRRLFWLTIAVIGFVFALGFAVDFLQGQPDWLIIVVALLTGLLGAILAIFLQQVAIVIGGFLLGGYLTILGLTQFGVALNSWEWVAYIVGGIIGALVVSALFEYALVIISAGAGAAMIVQTLTLEPLVATMVFIVLVLIGAAVQLRGLAPAEPAPQRQRRRRNKNR